jgi:leucyl aminopeptidase
MFKSIRVASGRAPMVIVGVASGVKRLPAGAVGPSEPSVRALRDGLRRPGFRAEAGELLVVGERAALLGLGAPDGLTLERLRTVGGRLIRGLDRVAPRAVELRVAGVVERVGLDARRVGQAIAEGAVLANWRIDMFAGHSSRSGEPSPALALRAADKSIDSGLREGLVIAEAVNEARRLAATPANHCTPASMAREARALAKKSGLTCRVIGAEQARQQGMGGLVNVGRGSRNKPCLIQLEHRPARSRKGVKLVLIGKTITFDTGGYSLKPRDGMKGMKYDKCGGCAVLGAMRAIATLKLPVHVVALLPAAENMVSDDAYRPDDIITMYDGTTVEVTNTDAEGRLVLADALAYASRRLRPTAIIDVATLTGGIVVALGSWSAGLFCNHDPLREGIEAAAEASGEPVWRMPLWEQHRDFMRAKHADLWNSGPKRDGHPIQGAAFLSYFVEGSIPWAHLDIAGVASVGADTDLYATGPTGYGVRLLTEYVKRTGE